jgi:hypothetical protein
MNINNTVGWWGGEKTRSELRMWLWDGLQIGSQGERWRIKSAGKLNVFLCTLVDTRQNIGQESFYVGKRGWKILYFVECPTSTLDKRKAGSDFLGAAKTTRKSYKTSSRDTRQREYSIIGSRPSNADVVAVCPACQVCFSFFAEYVKWSVVIRTLRIQHPFTECFLFVECLLSDTRQTFSLLSFALNMFGKPTQQKWVWGKKS